MTEFAWSSDARAVRLAALQRAADGTGLTPEGWCPGDPVLAPPPDRVGEANDGLWFCRTLDPS